jgi:membrane protein insertase Oxa1/YidC/SpoIIIJ
MERTTTTSKERKRVAVTLFLFYLALNPLFMAILYVYFVAKLDDVDKFALGIYSIIWFVFGIWYYLYPILKINIKKYFTPIKMKTPDELTKQAWEEYYAEKKKEQEKQQCIAGRDGRV